MRARLVTAVTAVATVATATLVPALMVLGAQPASAANGNSGTVKISEVGGAADESNDPHVGCSFDVQWYGFERSTSTVAFESQAPTQDATITVTGPSTVQLGAPASGSELNTIRTYTLAFAGDEPQQNQGYHVRLTVAADGANGNDTETKVFWVGPCATTSDPGTTDPTPFSWDWTYAYPTCAGVTVDYPSDIPDGQANDVNVRVETAAGTQTLNFHNNEGTWSSTHAFNLADHPQWNAGTASYAITWVQVGGTNYHWQGHVACVLEDGIPKAVTDVTGFRTGTLTVNRGSSVASDSVLVDAAGDQVLELQVWTAGSARGTATRAGGTWKTVRTVTTAGDGAARVTFPRLTKRGTYEFRLAVAGSAVSTGDTTGTLTVRVR